MPQRKAPPFVEVARILDGYFFTKGHAPPVRELRGLCGGEGSLETYSDYTKRWLTQKMLGSGAMASILAIQEQAKAHVQIIDQLLAQLQRALSMPVIENDDAVDLASGEEQLVSETDEHRGVQHHDSEPTTPQTSAGSSSETANVVADTSAHASSPEPNANGKPVRCSNGQETAPPDDEEAIVAVASAAQAPRQPTGGQSCSPNVFASSPAEPDFGIDMDRYTYRDDDDEDPVLRHHLSAGSRNGEHASGQSDARSYSSGENSRVIKDGSLSHADGGGKATHPAGVNKPCTGESDTSAKCMGEAVTSPVNEQPSAGEPTPREAGSGEPPLVSTKPIPTREAQ
ncbi:hypothetical protein [Erythrobacter tepidarius]|uniref:hypothetical protein n=1 Tax=Erythrobacter tepidarius TaxID=60454 RepID=UPI00117E44AC|nr:hypothetical protein [Erythrobacter tepidarius]